MIAGCGAQELARTRGAWRPADGGLDLVVDRRVVARVRRTPTGGWFWIGMRRNSTSGPNARPYEDLDAACQAVLARAREVFEGFELELRRRGPKPAAIAALDHAQPELAQLDGGAAADLTARMNLFCRDHLLGDLPDAVTSDDVEAVRNAVAQFHRTGAWPAELVEYFALG